MTCIWCIAIMNVSNYEGTNFFSIANQISNFGILYKNQLFTLKS